MGFFHTTEFWSSLIGPARRSDFISTESRSDQIVIRLRQDGTKGRPLDILARQSPRTVLGTINTEDKPTALAARREMQSWTFLQLEPSSLRLPSDFDEPPYLASDGAHLPAVLTRLGCYAEVANRLSGLLPGISALTVDVDEGRRLKTLFLTQKDGLTHPARSLSDGTLRFLALAVLAEDNSAGGLLALEEPENGIHPSRIGAVLQLLKDIAVNPAYPVGDDNPLRQVIITTHSQRWLSEIGLADK